MVRIEVTCTADQSSTGAISNGLNVAVQNTGKVDLPLVPSRPSERPQLIDTSGSTVTAGGAYTEMLHPDASIDNAHILHVETVANRRLTLDLADQGHRLDHERAFTDYEEWMRPLIDEAQDLPPGVPRIAAHPTAEAASRRCVMAPSSQPCP